MVAQHLLLADETLLSLEKPVIVSILNLTPDSFSDGGQISDIPQAVARAVAMAGQGARIIDVGGESTRPGAARIDADEQIRRVVEPIRRIRAALDTCHPQTHISIDTTLSRVAQAAVDAGATIVNDISAGREDPAMFRFAAKRRLPIILMHMQGTPATMQSNPHYEDVVAQVHAFLMERAAMACEAGIEPARLILDPGIGFGKTLEHNLTLMRHLATLVNRGHAVMVGPSRKRMIEQISPENAGHPAERLGGTCALIAEAVRQGAQLLRIHDVAACRQAAEVAWRLYHDREP